jgi:hypothetical protein
VAHAKLAEIWRLFGQVGATLLSRQPIYPLILASKAALFTATNGALKAMMGPIERIAQLFNWTVPAKGEEIRVTIDYMNAEMERLGGGR